MTVQLLPSYTLSSRQMVALCIANFACYCSLQDTVFSGLQNLSIHADFFHVGCLSQADFFGKASADMVPLFLQMMVDKNVLFCPN